MYKEEEQKAWDEFMISIRSYLIEYDNKELPAYNIFQKLTLRLNKEDVEYQDAKKEYEKIKFKAHNLFISKTKEFKIKYLQARSQLIKQYCL